jgi:hypothetical protein
MIVQEVQEDFVDEVEDVLRQLPGREHVRVRGRVTIELDIEDDDEEDFLDFLRARERESERARERELMPSSSRSVTRQLAHIAVSRTSLLLPDPRFKQRPLRTVLALSGLPSASSMFAR